MLQKEDVAKRDECQVCGRWEYATEMIWSELENLYLCRGCYQFVQAF